MKLIRVTSDPYPELQQPQEIRNAYIGLCLTPTLVFPPGSGGHYPQGVYLVPLNHVLNKIELHNLELYNFWEDHWGWGKVNNKMLGNSLLIPFSFDCCFECSTEAIQ
jgi:hypothetical protein